MREQKYSSIILNLSTGWKRAIFMPPPHYFQGKCPQDTLYKRLGRSQGRSGHYGEEKNLLPLPGIKP
jgi:hypothetical protein